MSFYSSISKFYKGIFVLIDNCLYASPKIHSVYCRNTDCMYACVLSFHDALCTLVVFHRSTAAVF